MKPGVWIASAAAVIAAGVVGAGTLLSRGDPPRGTLLVLADPRGETSIAFAAADGAPRIITRGFVSAEGPAPSVDGRRVLFAGRPGGEAAGGIWEMGVDGSGARLVTRGNGAAADPAWLPDGRILYSDVPSPGDDSSAWPRSLFSCAPDGSDPRRLTWGTHRDTRPTLRPDGLVVFDRTLSHVPGGPPVALRMTIRPDGTGVTAAPATEASRASGENDLTYAPVAGHTVVARVPVEPAPAPPALTSVVDPSKPTGTLLCLDVFSSRLPEVAGRERESVAAVRVSAIAAQGSEGGPDPDTILGEAPVHPDGSFFVEVPADTPLRLTLLDRSGSPVATFASGLWVRPNENRGCIGCHEEPDRVPENRVPQAALQPAASLGVIGALSGEDR